MNRGGAVTLVALLAAASAFGCGSSQEESVSKAAFARKGNTICAEWQRERNSLYTRITEELTPPVTQAQREEGIVEILRPYEKAVKRLRELSPPTEAAKQADAVIHSMEEAVARGKEDPGTLLATTQGFQKANHLAKAFGLTECTL